MGARVVVSNGEHVERLWERLREEPRLEVMSLQSARDTIERSERVWTGFLGDELACMVGVQKPTFLDERAYLWLATTPAVEDHKFLFLRYSQIFVAEALRIYPCLFGFVRKDFERSLKWLRFLGFTVDVADANCYYFEKRA